jgi:hypothetical protein
MATRDNAIGLAGVCFPQDSWEICESISPLQGVSAGAASLLRFQWLLNQPVVDLEALCDCIRNDSGILLHVLYAAVQVPAEAEVDLLRLENHVVHLGIAVLRSLACQIPVMQHDYEARVPALS